MKSHRALVSSLDWGLGHTTRTLPIIDALLKANIEVVFAGTKPQINWLKNTFPDIPTEVIRGANIHYGASNVVLSLVSQTWKINKLIQYNKAVCGELCEHHNVDMVISDENPGFYGLNTLNIYISHQMNIQGPMNGILNKVHNNLMKPYHKVWIPDSPEIKLSGKLGEVREDYRYTYIGLLSHLTLTGESEPENTYEYEYVGVLSGPEPLRSQFHKNLRMKLERTGKQCAIVGTSQLSDSNSEISGKITELGHLHSSETSAVLKSAKAVLCRSGYSSLMDLTLLQKPAYIEATSGQYEQEYLFKYCTEKHWFAPISTFGETNNRVPPTIDWDENMRYLKDAVDRLV